MKSIVIVFLSAIVLSGCMSASYQKPIHSVSPDKYVALIGRSYDEVWQNLIKYSANTFFSIENFEKDSGLITLTFGASEPSMFVTGGQWKSVGNPNFEGDYVEYLARYLNGNLAGKMNIVVSKAEQNVTNVMVKARYVFTVPPSPNSASNIWTFDTGSCATKRASNPALGTDPERTICPTYQAENAIIQALKQNSL